MLSPVFACSLEGLRSAVRLRYVLWGVEDPDSATDRYMDGWRVSEEHWDDPDVLRKRIELLIRDIEEVSGGGWTPSEVAHMRARLVDRIASDE